MVFPALVAPQKWDRNFKHTAKIHSIGFVYVVLLPKISQTIRNSKQKYKQYKITLKMIFVYARCHCWMSTAWSFCASAAQSMQKPICVFTATERSQTPIPQFRFPAHAKTNKMKWARARTNDNTINVCVVQALICIRTTFQQQQ